MSDLVPYVLGHGPWCERYAAGGPLGAAARFDVLDPAACSFYRLVNAGNRHAFGGLGMPGWVQLDCCTLPTAMIGLAAPRAAIEAPLWEALVAGVGAAFGDEAGRALLDHDGLVPLSEYCALPTPEPGHVVGFSLYALRRGLGLRTKALALRLLGARVQTGIAQYANPAVRTHAALGALEVVAARAVAHSRPDETFVYRLVLPPAEVLDELARTGRTDAVSGGPPDATVPVETAAAEVEALLARGARVAVVAPGHERRGERALVTLRVEG